MEFAEHRLWMDSVGGHEKRRPHLRVGRDSNVTRPQYHSGWRRVNLRVLPLIGMILIAIVWLRLMQAKAKTRLARQGA